jgi:signal recognition particle receptor subunit beta
MGHMIQDLWQYYMQKKRGLIFVVDSANHNWLGAARSLLNRWHNHQAPKGLPLLIYANKQDVPGALSVLELMDRLGLKDLHGRPWHIKVDSASESLFLCERLI